jgi:hypothetical protein
MEFALSWSEGLGAQMLSITEANIQKVKGNFNIKTDCLIFNV